MFTLGINAVFHDSAACIVKDGILLAAAEEERFTHIKHGKRPVPFSTYELPYHAINYCLEIAGIHLSQVDNFAYSFDPFLLLGPQGSNESITLPLQPSKRPKDTQWLSPWDPLFLSYIVNAPLQLAGGYPHHLQARFKVTRIQPEQWHFVEHHIAHAASAYHPSPFDKAAVLTLDGRGEIATTTYNIGDAMDLTRIGQVNLPSSLGLLYENVTTYLGFLHSSDEYKVMALASYGQPEFIKEFRDIVQVKPKGQYEIQNELLTERFGPARLRHEEFTKHHFNIARSLQYVLEETALELCGWLQKETKETNLCMAGGVALNCVMNARIKNDGLFDNVWVQPAAGDSGTALGAALWVDSKQQQLRSKKFEMRHAYWGPEYTDEQVEKFLKWTKVKYRKLQNIAEETAAVLAENKIIGWFQGKMEYGPRSLGSRSILASPIHADMQSRLNEVKDREDFRPVAPVVLEERAADWFELADSSPYMLFVFKVNPEKAKQIPAVRHVDGTARIQTINEAQHGLYYDLLTAFERITGVPVLVNTSFNTLGEPIVCTPADAVRCFYSSPFDALVIGSFILEK